MPVDCTLLHYNTSVFFTVMVKENLKNSYFENIWTAASESLSFYVSLNVFQHEQITIKTTQEKKKQKQSPEIFFKKKCFQKFRKIHSTVFSCEFWEISKNTFSYRTPPGDCILRRRFSQKQTKKKNILKLSQVKKNLPFHDDFCHFGFLYFSVHVWRCFPYLIKDDSDEGIS